MGTPDIAVNSLRELYKNPDINVLCAVTQPDRPKGRGNKLSVPAVKECALECGVKVYQTEKISADKELIGALKEMQPDFIVTFAFGQILSQEVLDIPKFAVINLHASLLPKYRGANPIQRCLFNGDKKTGITSMLTVLELDAGSICETEEIDIDENMNDIELREIISKKSPALIISTLKGLYAGSLIPKEQGSEGISMAKKFKKEDGLIDWNKSAECIHNQVRSMVSYPAAYTFFKGKMLKILETRKTGNIQADKPAALVTAAAKNGIEINTGQGCLLITKVKPESRGVMSAYDFANGAGIKEGMLFGE